MNVEPIGLLSTVLQVPKLFVNLVSIHRIAKLDNFLIIFEDIDAFSKITFTDEGLVLLKFGRAYIFYLVHHQTTKGHLTVKLQH